jgi:hypothetical protein
MMVRSGWNSEYARKKYDVELDEADLARILISGRVPLEAQSTLSLADAHNLLWFSAEIMARQSLASFDPTLKDKLQEEARELNQKRAYLLGKIRNQWDAAHGMKLPYPEPGKPPEQQEYVSDPGEPPQGDG